VISVKILGLKFLSFIAESTGLELMNDSTYDNIPKKPHARKIERK
jgi:hypothetical protein